MKIERLWPAPSDIGYYGKSLWKRVGKILVESGSLDELDKESFETLCRNYELMRSADEVMKEKGIIIDGNRGAPVKNPAFPIFKTAHDNYVGLLKHFGLSPMSRGFKVTPTERKAENEKEKFFQ